MLAGQAAGHGFDHVHRVLRTAREIQASEGGELLVIELAALLHDVGDAKFHDGVERSGELGSEILERLGAEQSLIEHVVHIVENLSFRKRNQAQPLSLEGQIVQDADRLDALGAIGIVRTIEYGAAMDQPFYVPENPHRKSGVSHFYDKLFHLRDLMNTETARQLAVGREQFMRQFLSQFLAEIGHASETPNGEVEI